MIEQRSVFWNQRWIVLVILILAAYLSLLKKGKHDVQEWDESRNGVNAYEMIQNGDYVNLYYNGELDTWNAKPPLMIWLIAGSYKIFGYNEFALRFPATLCSLIFFALCFYTIKLLDTSQTAFFTCLILLSCKAVIGNHIGLTGDFDVLLLVFLTASVYTFILYTEKQRAGAIFFTAIFTGLAFYTKGPASLVLIPGFILYMILARKMTLFTSSRLWLAIGIFVLIAGSWLFIVSKYGKTTEQSVYGTKNPIETMLFHDTYQRLTNSKFGSDVAYDSNYLFFFEVIDARLNLWNYFFYPAVVLGAWFLYKNKKNVIGFINQDRNKMVLLSICLFTPLSLILSLAATKHNWYLAPIFMYVAFVIGKTLLFFSEKWKPLYLIAGLLFLFTFTRQVYYIYSLPTNTHKFFTANNQLKGSSVLMTTQPKQVILLYLKWLGVTFIKNDEISLITKNGGKTFILSNKNNPLVTEEYKTCSRLMIDDYFLEEIVHR